jgi:hypothetical protein
LTADYRLAVVHTATGPEKSGQEGWRRAGIESVDEWRIVAVRDEDERPRRVGDHRYWREHRAGQCRRLEDGRFYRNEYLQVDCVIALRFLDRDALVLNVRGRMPREVGMHRCRMVIVVIRVDVRMQERRAHGAGRNGKRQPEREHAADHVVILSQKQMVLT